MRSFYAFVTRQDAETALSDWFAGEQKVIVAVRTPNSTALHLADTVHLESQPYEWNNKANSYWVGILTDKPFPPSWAGRSQG